MWLHNMQDVLIPFDTYIIHPEDVQFFWKSCVTFAVFLHLCQTRRLRPDETGFHQSFPYRTQRLSLHFLVVQFLGSQSQRWRNIKVMKSLSLVQDVSFFILLKWYVVFIWYIYIASTPFSCPGMTSLLVLSVSASRRFCAITSCHNCQNHARKLERAIT